MGPKEDFSSTFGRVFGEDFGSPRSPPPPRSCTTTPFDPPQRVVADRENFGVGFRRAPGTGVYSPTTRTKSVQDIILRDRGSAHQVFEQPVMRYDVLPSGRNSPTMAITSTTHQENNAPAKSSHQMVAKHILPGYDAVKVESKSKASPSASPKFKYRSLSPGQCPTKTHLKGGQVLEEPSLTSPTQQRAEARVLPAQQTSVEEVGPARFTKKRFPDRKDFGGGSKPQEPGLDGGEFAASTIIGDVVVPEGLELRPEQAELTKKIVRRHAPPPAGQTASEWQYRTREIVTQRSKERGRCRWH